MSIIMVLKDCLTMILEHPHLSQELSEDSLFVQVELREHRKEYTGPFSGR